VTGFFRKNDCESVIKNMRLSNGTLWSIPIILDVDESLKTDIIGKTQVEIHDEKNQHIATLMNCEIYSFDKNTYCQSIFGTLDLAHPGVARIMKK
jgi:sulfate adenylyltransferase